VHFVGVPLNWLDKKRKQEHDQENEIISFEDKDLVSRKLRKTPVKLSRDFLWTNQSKKK
jgi:hypothetical protein